MHAGGQSINQVQKSVRNLYCKNFKLILLDMNYELLTHHLFARRETLVLLSNYYGAYLLAYIQYYSTTTEKCCVANRDFPYIASLHCALEILGESHTLQ